MEIISTVVSTLSNWLFGTVLIWLLLGAGAFLTWRTRAVQLRHLGSIARAVAGSRSGAAGGISSFQAFTIGLAKEVAAEGIRVNAVRPGLIETDIHASGGLPDRVRDLAHQVPMQRGGSAEEVAQAIVWLLSDAASYTTMSLLDVSGGR